MNSSELDYPVIQVSWPRSRQMNLKDACKDMGFKNDLEELRSNLSTLDALRIAPAPIIGVLGLVNSGKSSFVKSFLSNAGADRVLCGSFDKHGTQRFVFWLPEKWKNEPAVLEAFKSELRSIFDAGYEELDEAPVRAHSQYNGDQATADRFPIPLLAFDSALDEFGFGLLDCPDFERKHPGVDGKETARVRKDFVRKAGKLTSASIVIGEVEGVSKETFVSCADPEMNLLDKDRFVFLNKMNPKHDLVEWSEDSGVVGILREFGLHTFYTAYDWEKDQASSKIPTIARELGLGNLAPVVFEVAKTAEENHQDSITEERLIQHALRKLQPAEMWKKNQEACKKRIRENLESLQTGIEGKLEEQTKDLAKCRKGLIAFIRSQVTKEEKLAFPVPPQIAEQMMDTIYEKSPWWAKPTFLTLKSVQRAVATAKSVVKSIKTMADPKAALGSKYSEMKDEFSDLKSRIDDSDDAEFFSAKEWAKKSMRDKFMPDDAPKEKVLECWGRVLKHANNRILRADIKVGDQTMEAFVKEMWDEVPLAKRLLLAGAGPVLLLGSLTLLIVGALDGGAGLILFTYSVKQFFVAIGLGFLAPVVSGFAGERLEKEIVERAGVPYYSSLIRASLDVFGLPRGDDLEQTFKNTEKIKIQMNPASDETPLNKILAISKSDFQGTIDPKLWGAMIAKIEENSTQPA